MGKVISSFIEDANEYKYSTMKCAAINDLIMRIGRNNIHEKAISKLTNHQTQNTNFVKLFELEPSMFEAVDFRELHGVVNEQIDNKNKFMKGGKYALRNIFGEITDLYELVGVVDKLNGINVNYVIMKSLDENDKGFTLSEHDCQQIGIEYQEGLSPFPKTMNWDRVIEQVDFDKNDLSTTPRSIIDETIRYVAFVLHGFEDYSDGYILSPSGKLVKEESFLKSFRVINNEPIVYNKDSHLKEGNELKREIVKPTNFIFNHGNFISDRNEIYVVVELKQFKYNSNTNSGGFYGVNPIYVKGMNPNDMFSISWDEFGCLTVEEYEKLKAERKKAEEERIAKAEAERKRIELERVKRVATSRDNLRKMVNNAPNISLRTLDEIKSNTFADMDIYTTSAKQLLSVIEHAMSDIETEISNIILR